MVERIIPKTDGLAERERRAIEDMRALFPDGNVSGLDTVDKSLGKRLSKLYVALGYDSRSDMIEALGFRQERTNMGGRPTTTDPEAIIAELLERYEGMEKPQSIGILIYENPDLKGPIKTLQNKANEFFGQTLANELRDRGLIDSGPKSSDVSEDDIRELLEKLAAKYADAAIKPNSMAELKADNPESKAVLAAFNDRCRLIFGVTARNKLVELGIFEKPKSAVIDAGDDDIWQAVEELSELIFVLDDAEKPKTLADLQKTYPELGEYIKAGKKKGLLDKGPLQELGILSPTRALLKRDGIRRASAESLVADYASMGRAEIVKPGDPDESLLPPNVVGFDIVSKIELREFIATVKGAAAKSLGMGDKVSISVAHVKRDWGDPYLAISIQTMPMVTLDLGSLCEGALNNSGSELSSFMGGEVVSASHGNGYDAAQIRVRFLGELSRDTLAYALRELGIVTEKDVRGSMEWRYRLRSGGFGKEPTQASAMKETAADSGFAPPRASSVAASEGLTPLQRSKFESVGDAEYAFMDDPGIPDRLKEYLKVIADLCSQPPRVRSADVVARTGCSRSTFSAALQKLKEAGCVTVEDGYIVLQEGARDKASGALASYVDAIEELYLEPPRVRSADVVAETGCAKATFSDILQKLRSQKLVMEKDGYIMLTSNVALLPSTGDLPAEEGGPQEKPGEIACGNDQDYEPSCTDDLARAYSEEAVVGASEVVGSSLFGSSVKGERSASTALPVISDPPFALSFANDPVIGDSADAPIPPAAGADLSGAAKGYFDKIAECIAEGMRIRSLELAGIMGVSTAAVAKTLPAIKEAGLIETDIDGYIRLTDLGYRVTGLTPEKSTEVEGRAFLNDPNISESQKRYLIAIADIADLGRDVKAVEIADVLNVSKASVSKALGGLEELGYITRDGRAISLTSLATGFIEAPAAEEVGAEVELNLVEAERLRAEAEEIERRRLEEECQKAAEEQLRRDAEEAARKAEEEERKRQAAEEEQRRVEEEARRQEELRREEEKRKQEEAARKAEEEAQAKTKFFEYDKEIKALRARIDGLSKPEETPSEKKAKELEAEIARMQKELSGLGLFARAKKKELQASISAKQASLAGTKEKIPSEREAAEAKRRAMLADAEGELEQIESEARPYKAIVLKEVADGFKGAVKGDVVLFGSYKQESGSAKPTPIEWIVVEADGKNMTLLSKRVLDYRKFNNSKGGNNTYEASDLRKWIIGTFASEAFSAVDQLFLRGEPYIPNDKELRKFLPSDSSRQCEPTKYAVSKGAEASSYYKVAGYTFYWVGTPEGNDSFYYVNPYGAVLGGGGFAYVGGESIGNYGMDSTYQSGVRPAVRICMQ